MNRILVQEFPTMMVGRIVEDLGLEENVSFDDLITEMKTFIFAEANVDGLTYNEFENSFRGIVLVKIPQLNRSASDVGRVMGPLREFTVDKVERILANMRQSGDDNFDISMTNIEVHYVYERPLILGAGSKTTVSFMKPHTAITQTLVVDGEEKKLNCAAFAIAYHVAKFRNVKRSLGMLKQRAYELQTELGFGEYVEINELKRFVQKYPEYRLTVILPAIDNHSRYTFTGQCYHLEFNSPTGNTLTPACADKTIYLLYSMIDKHYGLPTSPSAYRNVGNSDHWIFCHACTAYKCIFTSNA